MKDKKGFSAVVVLLAIIALTLIGFSGYYVYSQQSKNKDITSSSKVTENNPIEKPLEPSNNTISSQKYLVVKEWGVKFKLSDNILDANYNIVSNDYDEYLVLSTDKLNKINPECTDYASGHIIRYKGPDDIRFTDADTLYNYDYLRDGAIKVNDYYYNRLNSQAPCPDEGPEFGPISGALVEAFSTIEPSN